MLKPEFFSDESLAHVSHAARLLFAGLWTLADRKGRLRDQAPVIHGALFPYEPNLEVQKLLDELTCGGFILRYEVDGKRYLQVRNFERHQRPHPKEPASLIPEPCKGNGSAVECTRLSTSESESVPSVPSESESESESEHTAVRSLRAVENPRNGNGRGVRYEDRPSYADAVWESFRERFGIQRLTASSVEGVLVSRWMDRGIPLAIVLRGVGETGGRPMNLTACEKPVERAVEYWQQASGTQG
jgi:hypothetical protein